MKKIHLFLVFASIALMMACNKESYYHDMGVTYPYPSERGLVYADQLLDSVVFISTDNFVVSTNEKWITIPEDKAKGDIPYAYRSVWVVSVPLYFEPNTTGKPRSGNVMVQSYGDDDWNTTATASYFQLSWIHITQPTPIYDYVNNEFTNAHFEAKEPATLSVPDTLKFEAHGAWNITEGTSFVHPQQLSGSEGFIKLPLDVDNNESAEERNDAVTLTINGVSTEIKFVQEAKSI